MTRSLVTEKRRAEVGRDPLVCVGKELAQAPAPAEMLDTSLRDVARSLALVGPGDAPGGDALVLQLELCGRIWKGERKQSKKVS